MKKILVCILLSIAMCGCTGTNQDDNQPSSRSELSKDKIITQKLDEKIKITIENQEVIISLYNTEQSKMLLNALPLDCQFNDYGNCEKAANIRDVISLDDVSIGYEPEPGDVVVYEPWGNFTVFYDNFRYSDYLFPIGIVDSGLNVLSSINGDFEAHVEIVE